MLAPAPGDEQPVREVAARGMAGGGGALPFRDRIQRSFGGYDISHVQAYTDAHARDGAAMMGAHAYASGHGVVLGEGGTDLHTVAHEAAHVVQQRAGVSLSGGVGRAGDLYERHADAVADRVVAGESAEALLAEMAPGEAVSARGDGVRGAEVQRRETLLPTMAEEDGEGAQFAARVTDLGVSEKNARVIFSKARTKYLSGDPRMHTLAGAALDVDGTWPTVELIAAVYREQASPKRGSPRGPATGFPTIEQLETWLLASPAAAERDENRDLFRAVSGRSASDGQKDENRAHRAEFNACNGPFLGMGWMPGAGVNAELYGRLMKAESQLLGLMSRDIDARGPVVRPTKGTPLTRTRDDLKDWAGIRERHRGFKAGKDQGYHKTGSAMDLNYHSNPWMAVRSGSRVGGDAAVGGKIALANEAIDAIDRASLWVRGQRAQLHVSPRPEGASEAVLADWAGRVWERFNAASEAVASYFSLAYAIDRDAKLAELASENEKLRGLHGEEVDDTAALLQYRSMLGSLPARPRDEALSRISASMHTGRPWTKDPEAALTRMGPDLQAIAKVMVRGNVSDSPRAVRNPTLGLFDIQKEVLQAMMGAAGLHWGGCEFGKAWSGDMMHFDLGFVPRNLK